MLGALGLEAQAGCRDWSRNRVRVVRACFAPRKLPLNEALGSQVTACELRNERTINVVFAVFGIESRSRRELTLRRTCRRRRVTAFLEVR